MKKQYLNIKTIFTLCGLAISSFASSQSELQWANNTGNGMNLNESITDICADKNINSTANQGNTISVGTFDETIDADPGAGVSILTSNGGYDILVRKLDPDGNLIWAKSFGGYNNEAVYSVVSQSGGEVYLTGSFRGEMDIDPGIGEVIIGNWGETATNSFVMALDANGDFLWANSFGDSGTDYGTEIAVDGNGNIYAAGFFQGTVDFDPSAATFNLTGAGGSGYGLYLVKFDYYGNFVWAIEGGGSAGNNRIEDLVIDLYQNVVMVGSFGGTADFDPGIGVESRTANSDDIFVWKLNPAGEYMYAHAIGGMWGDYAFGATTENGNVFVTGHFRQTVDFDPGVGTTTLDAGSDYHCYLLKLNSAGDFQWVQETSGWFTEGTGLTTYNIEGSVKIHMTGRFEGASIFDPNGTAVTLTSTPSNNDIFIATYNNDGTFVSADRIGGMSEDIGRSITSLYDYASNDMAIYIAGSFVDTVDFDPSGSIFNLNGLANNTSDMFVAKFGTCTLANTTSTNGATITATQTSVQYQWIDCDNSNSEINGATSQSFTATSNGSYAVVITKGACVDTSDCVVINSLGVNSLELSGISISPNPAKEILTISSEAVINGIMVLDATGKVVKTETQSSFSVAELKSGIYFLTISTDKGIVQRKFIKE